MKKKNLKSLGLNKSSISNLTEGQLNGGSSITYGCLSYRGWTCPHDASDYCGGGTETCGLSCNGGSECHCL
ncbi:class I lanthipeptide [Kordia sp.]|uniref:class I lanthipeptide n=1 Tax=Kordia sp. TaxID=1965332 RepID=UPI0025BAD330|nr:class I lanthipeptide [Kordia sp.]MCH2192931.1 class I lanthipeptide [Kordia sp.]